MFVRRLPSPIITTIATVVFLALILLLHKRSGPQIGAWSIYNGSRENQSPLGNTIYNATFGFEKVFVVGLPSRTDRRDGMILGAALSGLEIEFIDGGLGSSVVDKAIPSAPDYKRPPDPVVGSWRAHMNAIQEVVRKNLSSALIMEDDADWDIRIRQQLHDFSASARALTQPLLDPPSSYADPTYPHPPDSFNDVAVEFPHNALPVTIPPTKSPYGDEWDVLWLGQCGMRFPTTDNKVIPKGRVVQHDDTVPQQRFLWTITAPDPLKEQYPDHTRVVHHVQDGVCSLTYAITQKAARQLLYEVGLKKFDAAFDILLRWFCEGFGDREYHNCLTVQPSLFQHHRPVGPKSAESDITDHGEGFRTTPHTNVLRWSVRMNAEALMEGRTDFIDQYPDQ